MAWKELKGGFGINFDTVVNNRIYKPWRENMPQDASNRGAYGLRNYRFTAFRCFVVILIPVKILHDIKF